MSWPHSSYTIRQARICLPTPSTSEHVLDWTVDEKHIHLHKGASLGILAKAEMGQCPPSLCLWIHYGVSLSCSWVVWRIGESIKYCRAIIGSVARWTWYIQRHPAGVIIIHKKNKSSRYRLSAPVDVSNMSFTNGHTTTSQKRQRNGSPKVSERRPGYDENGKKKRILLNAFDMNGIGHVRYACLLQGRRWGSLWNLSPNFISQSRSMAESRG